MIHKLELVTDQPQAFVYMLTAMTLAEAVVNQDPISILDMTAKLIATAQVVDFDRPSYVMMCEAMLQAAEAAADDFLMHNVPTKKPRRRKKSK